MTASWRPGLIFLNFFDIIILEKVKKGDLWNVY